MTATLHTPSSDAEECRRRARTSHDVSEQALREICSIELIEAQLHHRKLAAILRLRDNAGGVLVDGGTAGAARPHPSGGRGDTWLGLDDLAAVDLAAATHVSEGTARGLVALALQTRTRLAPAAAALRTGVMSPWKLRILTDETVNCDNDLTRVVQVAVLPHAVTDTPTRFTQRVRAEIIRADGDLAGTRRKVAAQDRYVSIRPDTDGMASFFGRHTAVNLKAVDTALNVLAASSGPVDPRTLAQRRADALIAAVLGPAAAHPNAHVQTSLVFDPDGATPTVGPEETAEVTQQLHEAYDRLAELNWTIPRPPQITVHLTVPASVLAGADRVRTDRVATDRNGPTRPGDDARIECHPADTDPATAHITTGRCTAAPRVGVAMIDGLGPVDPDLARHLAIDARWIQMITDPVTGVIRDVGTTVYTFPAAMGRRIKARDHHCRFPGCTRPARRCDIDHVSPYPDGPTAETNALTLCTRHHRVKHQTRWRITLEPDSTAVWTSPTGQQHRTKPPPGD